MVCNPDRVGEVYKVSEVELRTRPCINIHKGKAKLWNSAGVMPSMAKELTEAARDLNPQAVVRRGDQDLPPCQQGLTVLGAPVGNEAFICNRLREKGREHERLLRMIPHVQDVQAAWLLLLFCASTRANFLLRTVQPELTQEFAQHHDDEVIRCLCEVIQIEGLDPPARAKASLPLTLGGLGLASAVRIRDAAHWGSWADCLEMTNTRHPDVARVILRGIAGRLSPCPSEVEGAAGRLQGLGKRCHEVCVPSTGCWRSGSLQTRSTGGRKWLPRQPTVVWPLLSASEKGLVRSQSGPLASVPFTAVPVLRTARLESQVFRVFVRCDVSICLYPCLFVHVPAAVFSTYLATTGQRAAWQGFSEEGIRSGKRSRTNLPRRRSKGVHERHGEGSGHRADEHRRTQIGSYRRRSAVVWWGAAGPRRNPCVATTQRWHATPKGRRGRRCGVEGGSQKQGDNIAGTLRPEQTSQAGCHCGGDWWQVLAREPEVPPEFGARQGTVSAEDLARQREGCVVQGDGAACWLVRQRRRL